MIKQILVEYDSTTGGIKVLGLSCTEEEMPEILDRAAAAVASKLKGKSHEAGTS